MADPTIPRCSRVRPGAYLFRCGEVKVDIWRGRDGLWHAREKGARWSPDPFASLQAAKEWAYDYLVEVA